MYRQSDASQIITVFVFKISTEIPSTGELKRMLETNWSEHFSNNFLRKYFSFDTRVLARFIRLVDAPML